METTGLGRHHSCAACAVLLFVLLGAVLPGTAYGREYLSSEERAFLDAHGRIALIYDWKYPPFEFVDADGSFSGLAADLIKELEQELGIVIVAEAEQDWPTLLDKLRSRQADMAPAMAYTAERAQYLLFTDPYVHLPTVVFTQKGFKDIAGLKDLRGMRVGVVNGYVSHTFLKNNYKDHFTIVPLNNIQAGLRAVAFGEVDAFVENVGVASYYIEKEGLRNLRVAAETEHQTALSMAVRSDRPLLYSAIQKALQHIPHERKRVLTDKWVHPREEQIRTLTLFLYMAVGMLSVMVLLLGALLIRGRQLRKDIQGKARELVVELERSRGFQQALQQNELYLRGILANSEAIIFQVDPQGTLLFADGKELSRAGMDEKALPGISAFDLFASVPVMENALRTCLRGQGSSFTANIGEEYYQGACSPELDPDGTVKSAVIVATNITQLESVRRALHVGEERLRFALEASSDGLWDWNYVSGTCYFSPRWFTMLGYRPDELPHAISTWEEMLHPAERERVVAAQAEALEAGRDYTHEYRMRAKDGEYRWILARCKVVERSADGMTLRVVGVNADITERKQAQERYRAIFSNAPIGIFRTTYDGKPLEANPALFRMLGYAQSPASPLPVSEVGLEVYADPEARTRLLHALQLSPQGISAETTFKRSDGSTFPALIHVSLHRDDDGNPQFLDGTVEDITERKGMERALRESEEKYRAIFNNSPIGIFRSTFLGGLMEVNAAVARMHAFASTEQMLSHVRDLAFDAYPDPGERRKLLDALLATPKGVRMELRLRRSTGEVFPAILNASLQMGPDGAPLFIDGTIEDITDRKLLELRLADQLAFQEALMDTIPYAVFYKNAETRFVGCNKAYEEMFGIRREEFIGKRVLDLEYLPEKDRQAYQAEDEETIASLGRVRREMAIPFADGMVHQTLYSVNGFRQADGTPGGLIGIIVDITDLKRAEMALRESEARYRLLVDNSADAVVLTDLDGNILDANEAMEQMLGYSSAELRRLKVWDVDLNVPAGGFRGIWEKMAPERPVTIETVHRARDGSLHEVEVRASRVEEGGRTYVLGMTRDITERKRGEAALRESEARFRAFMDNLPGYVVIKDAESRPVYFNQRFLDTFPGEQWLDKTPGEVFAAPVSAQMLETDAKALSDGFVVFTEDWHDRNGEHRLLETRKFRIRQETGQSLIGAIITDITEQRYNEEKYRVLFHASTDAIFMIKDNRIVDCNPRTLTVFDCPMERMMGHNPGEFSPPVQPGGRDSVTLAREMIERARRGDTHTFEWQHLRCDGSAFTAEVTLTVMDLFREEYVVAFLRDISERKQMQELMVQTEKMMSVGGLAAGMAHELNNPLGIILQSVQNMERRLSTSLPKNQAVARELALNLETVGEYMRARGIDEYMRGIQEAGDRAAKIIRTMLDFSRSSQSVRASCDVNVMLDTALGLAANDYDLKKKYDFRNIVIQKDYDQGTGVLECTETEIVQVLLNIIKNAAQAMPARGDRTDPPTLRLHSRILTDAVRIEIEDNGPGMDEATRRRVFEPFFTTKPQGEGTGLGLSVGYFIITQKHKGRISVESNPGMGTTFAIELPLR